MSGNLWLIYRRRSRSDVEGAGVSDQSQLDECRALVEVIDPGARYEVIDDLGGTRSGRGTKNRPGWTEVIRRVEAGGVAGVVAKDVSRLARNAGLVRKLADVCAAKNTRLRLADMPSVDPTTPEGKLLMAMMANVAEMYSDLLSRTISQTAKTVHEAGGVWAKTPFGYRTVYRDDGSVEHVDRKARVLAIEPDEAAVVRRVFDLLPEHPFREVAAVLQAEGAAHAQTPAWQRAHPDQSNGWTTNTVKDIYRRRDFYAGRVTRRRGAEVEEGRHEPILTPTQYADAVAGVEARKHRRGKGAPTRQRVYVLRGLVYCSECGSKMRGETRKARGKEWRYYTCPVADGRSFRPGGSTEPCSQRRVPADTAESFVLGWVVGSLRDPALVDAIREDLRTRLAAPVVGQGEADRQRLATRLRKLADLYSWGDIEEAEYRKQRREVEAALAALPAPDDKLVHFDQRRALFASLADEMAEMAPEDLAALVSEMVVQVWTRDQQVVAVVPRPDDLAFYDDEALAQGVGVGAPPDGLRGSRTPTERPDPLAWYAGVA